MANLRGQVQHDRPGDRGIERGDLSIHRQPEQKIAFLAHELPDAFAFRANHDGQPAIQPDFIGRLGARAFIQSHHPGASLFEGFDGLYQVHLRHEQMLGGAG